MREEFADRLKKMLDGELVQLGTLSPAEQRERELEMVVALHEAANAINAGKTFRPTAG